MKTRLLLSIALFVVLITAIAGLAACNQPQPTPSPTPIPTKEAVAVTPTTPEAVASPTPAATSTPPPTAPRVVATSPDRGEEWPLQQPLTIDFDRAVDPASVSLIFTPTLEGEMDVEGATVRYLPASFTPGQRYEAEVSASAAGHDTGPLRFKVTMQGYLEVANTTPADGNKNVSTDAPLTIAFNRPVVALGAAPDDPKLPQPLILDPPATGKGQWLNTSIYQFQPDPPLLAGSQYQAAVSDVTDLAGSPMQAAHTFTFTTDLPVVVKVLPEGNLAPPTSTVTIAFSQPMDHTSTEAAVSITAKSGAVAGGMSWSEDSRTLMFKPTGEMPLGETVTVDVSDAAQASGSSAGLRRSHTHTFAVAPYPVVVRTTPANGATGGPLDEPVQFVFNTPLLPETLDVSISPPVSATQVYSYYSEYDNIFNLFFPRQALSTYTVTLAAGVSDPWGHKIKEPTVVRFRTGERTPEMAMVTPGIMGTYSAYTDTAIIFQHVNINEIKAALYSVTPEQLAKLDPLDDYERWNSFLPPANQLIRRWSIDAKGARNQMQTTREVLHDASGEALSPGIYLLTAESPQVSYAQGMPKPRVLLIVSRYQTVIKRGQDDALVWVTDLATGKPAPNLPVTVYPFNADPVSGQTDADGVFAANVPASAEPWRSTDAFVGTAEDVGWASTSWSDGISAWNYNLPFEFYNQPYRLYLYTDRPLYRAADTIHFRGVVRTDDDVTYDVPANLTLPVELRNPNGDIIYHADLTTDAFGAVYGDIPLAEDAMLGVYSLEMKTSDTNNTFISFMVAAFRKPEYEVKPSVQPAEVIATQPATATVQASYYFGGPVKNADVRWTLYSGPYVLPYDDGKPWSFADFIPDAFYEPSPMPFREPIGNGVGKTDATGAFSFDVPTDLSTKPGGQPGSQDRVIEFAVTDVSDQEVAGSTHLVIHAGEVYPGVYPDSYVGTAGTSQLAHLIAVDALTREPKPQQSLDVTVSLVAWRTVRERGDDNVLRYVTKVEEEKVTQQTLVTGVNGQVELHWTPKDPGQYLIRVVARDDMGNNNRSAAFAYIAGSEDASWPVRNNDRIELVTDKKLYRVGDTAQVLVPAPWKGPLLALVTVERGGILSHEVVTLASNAETLAIPITAGYTPDVFVSVVLVSPGSGSEAPSFKLGLAELNVDPEQKLLDLAISAAPDPAKPGDTVTYKLHATDWEGKPVEAQLSLALVDRALLALQPVAGTPIDQVFWGQRGLGVVTGVSLVASLNRVDEAQTRGTKGGGGAGGFGELAMIDVRTDFRDLAYWRADAETDANGDVEVKITLPDNLTTWQMRAVGVTQDTQVVDATQDLLVTKPLFIRPVLPRFVVHGDKPVIGAIVQNNTGADQTVDLAFDLQGLQAQGETSYRLQVPNGELVRVDLPVVVDDIDPTSRLVLDDVVVRMTAIAPGFNDAIEVNVPVRRYSSPETVATAGVVPPDEPRYEAISLPERYDPTQGDLTVRLDPSLAAGMTAGLDYLKHFEYECTEQTVSRFLPNVLTARALKELGIANPALTANLDEQVGIALQRLYNAQNADGGWGWFGPRGGAASERSNPYTSAYVLYGMTEAQATGYTIDDKVMARGADYLGRQIKAPAKLEGYALNQQAFIVYVLDAYTAQSGGDRPLSEAQQLYEERERMAIYAQAYLALTLQAQAEVADTAAQARSLLDAISGKALVSATGAHWEEQSVDYWTMNTDTRSTAAVLAALVAIQPDHPLGPNVVRWLMSARTADRWQTTHETAWALIALTDWMVSTGELQGRYDWKATLNGGELGNGSVTPATVTESTTLHTPIGDLLADQINTLLLERTAGPGQLYYSAYLRTFLPVPDLAPVSRGLTVDRRYTLNGAETDNAITSAKVGDVIDVELTLVVPETMHYLVVEDPIPAGAEPIDTSLATTSQSAAGPQIKQEGEPEQPWWYWQPASFQLKDDKVALFATSLAPGTYTFTYQLRATLPGEYNVLPPRGEMMYFPEVFGHGAGSAFTITKP